jgi:hypothetical protein
VQLYAAGYLAILVFQKVSNNFLPAPSYVCLNSEISALWQAAAQIGLGSVWPVRCFHSRLGFRMWRLDSFLTCRS